MDVYQPRPFRGSFARASRNLGPGHHDAGLRTASRQRSSRFSRFARRATTALRAGRFGERRIQELSRLPTVRRTGYDHALRACYCIGQQTRVFRAIITSELMCQDGTSKIGRGMTDRVADLRKFASQLIGSSVGVNIAPSFFTPENRFDFQRISNPF